MCHLCVPLLYCRRIGQPLADAEFTKAEDGGMFLIMHSWVRALLERLRITETSIEVGDSVRGKDVFIIQTGSG